jgi:hypothetical protein
MATSCNRTLIAAILVLATCAIRSAANEPPADLCSLLPAADVSKALGQTYSAPEKSVAPRPFKDTNEGTDCNYNAKGSKFWFRAYVDPSPSEAKDLFARLSKYYGPQTPVPGLGDEAYLDAKHAIHVRKGRIRYYLNITPVDSVSAVEKQLTELANRAAAQL